MKREKEEEEETPQGKRLEKRNRVEKKEREREMCIRKSRDSFQMGTAISLSLPVHL